MKQLLLAITAIGMAAICQSQTLPQSISNPKIYGLALNGKAKEILAVLDTMKLKSKNDSLFKEDSSVSPNSEIQCSNKVISKR